MIPKIIHQTGPLDKQKWHPLWFKCQQSWLDCFENFDYIFWNDEDIDNLVKNHYSQYYDMYVNFPLHIMKIDFARFCILHKYGGIYSDLDMFCYQNFYDELKDGAHLVEDPYGNDLFENSLMISNLHDPFFLMCMEKSLERYVFVKEKYPKLLTDSYEISKNTVNSNIRPYVVFFISGCNLISTVARENPKSVYILPGCVYNNINVSYDPLFKTKHMHTGVWGKEDNVLIKDLVENYQKRKKINLHNFDFYTDYTNGNYLKLNEINLYKNDVDCESKLFLTNEYH